MDKRVISLSLIFFAIILVAGIIIAYGRGYRPDLRDKKLKPTGILVATSKPDGARVYINDKLKTATNNTINLSPGWYEVEIQKDGYFPWKKNLRIQGEIVTKTDALLLPTAPSLKAITSSGALNPTLSPLANRLVYGVASASAEKTGVYILDLVERPLLGGNTRQIFKDSYFIPLSQASYLWSPDQKKIIAYFKKNQEPDENLGLKTKNQEQKVLGPLSLVLSSAYLLDADKFNEVPQDITLTYQTILSDWQKELEINEKQRINSLKPKLLREIIKSWQIISWSPDETKILYTATTSATLPQIIKPPLIGTNCQKENRELEPGKVYVYDTKEDKNFEIGALENLIPSFPPPAIAFFDLNSQLINYLPTQAVPSLQWLSDSSHLVLSEKDKISILEYDGYNKTTIYAGPFIDNYVFPWPDGSRIVILTNYNPLAGIEANLYTISLR